MLEKLYTNFVKIKQLNFNEIGLWDLKFKIAFIFIVNILFMAIAYMVVFDDKFTQIAENKLTKKQLIQKLNLSVNNNMNNNVIDEEQILLLKTTLERMVPDKLDINSYMVNIGRLLLNNNLQLISFKVNHEKLLDNFLLLPLNFELSGKYKDFYKFLMELCTCERLTDIEKIDLSRIKLSNNFKFKLKVIIYFKV